MLLTWSSTSRGHDARILHLGQPEITDHDLGILIRTLVKEVLRFQISVHHALSESEKKYKYQTCQYMTNLKCTLRKFFLKILSRF